MLSLLSVRDNLWKVALIPKVPVKSTAVMLHHVSIMYYVLHDIA